MITIEINGKELEVQEGITILKACEEAGITVPTLCFHPLLEPYAACRICVVEVTQMGVPKIVTACNTIAENRMVINTESKEAVDTRKMNLELLMAQAPAAEAVQKLAKDLGIAKSRFAVADPEQKCILCGLCVRACEKIVGANILGFKERGVEREVTTAFEEASEKCIACGSCAFFCPTEAIIMKDLFDRKIIHNELYLGPPKAIRTPTMTPVPNVPFIDKDHCIHFKTGECKICERVCEPEAIKYEMEEEEVELDVGTIILTTGYDLYDCRKVPLYGYGKLPNVITSLEFEHLCNASGPTGGKLLMENGEEPGSIGIIHCVGSRDKNFMEYCSKICCMYSLKFSHLVHEKTQSHVYEFYIDMRSGGKGYEDFYRRMLEEGVTFIRGRAAEVSNVPFSPEEEGKLIIRCEDTLAAVIRRIPVDMVILCPAIVARSDAQEVARIFGLGCGNDGFFREQHPKLGPVSTVTDGLFIAGACQGPKDIPESIAQGAGAAAAALSLGEEIVLEPIYAVVNDELCSGCKICIGLCPYDAITFDNEKKVSVVNEMVCKGCGVCVAACGSGANYQKNYRDQQIFAEIDGAMAIME